MVKHNCVYAITPSRAATDLTMLDASEPIKKILALFLKYDIKYTRYDTMDGWFNLDQEWIEMVDPIEMETDWRWVLPINKWDEEDCDMILGLVKNGEIVIQVFYISYDEEGNRIQERHS